MLATRVNGNRKPSRTLTNCPVCNQAHKVEDCPNLKRLDVDQHAQRVKEKSLCFPCLSSSEHRARECSVREGCGVDGCLKHHHPLIHGALPVFVGAAIVGCSSPTVLLQLVPLLVEKPKGDIYTHLCSP